MRRVLHILTEEPEALQECVLRIQSQDPHLQTSVVDLTRPDVDYRELLREIFASDSVQVW